MGDILLRVYVDAVVDAIAQARTCGGGGDDDAEHASNVGDPGSSVAVPTTCAVPTRR